MAFGKWRKVGGNINSLSGVNSLSLNASNRENNGGLDQSKQSNADFVVRRFGLYEKLSRINGSQTGVSGICCTDEYIIFPTTMKAGETYNLSVGNAKTGCTYFWQMVSLDNVGTDGSAGTAGTNATSSSTGSMSRLYGNSISYTAPSGANCDFHSGLSLYCNGNQVDGVSITMNRCPSDGYIRGYVDPAHTELSSNIFDYREQQKVYLTTGVEGSAFCGTLEGNVQLWKEGDGVLSDNVLTFNECYQRATLRLSCCERLGTGSTRGYHLRRWDETSEPEPPPSVEDCGEGYEREDMAISWYSTTCQNCPDESVSISYTTLSMKVGESQSLSSSVPYINPVTGIIYNFTWSLSGGGRLTIADPGNVIYTAPAANPNCELNPTITLSCGGVELDHIDIAISGWNESDIAYSATNKYEEVCYKNVANIWVCEERFTYDYMNCYDERVFYYGPTEKECDEWELTPWPGCAGCYDCTKVKSPCFTVIETEQCDLPPPGDCADPCNNYCSSPCPPGDGRTPEMIAGGCCPSVFWCRDTLKIRKAEKGC